MTQTNVRRFLFSLLVFASFACFIYINTVQVQQIAPENKEYSEERVDEEEDEEVRKPELTLPDVEVVKMLIRQGKRMLPVS